MIEISRNKNKDLNSMVSSTNETVQRPVSGSPSMSFSNDSGKNKNGKIPNNLNYNEPNEGDDLPIKKRLRSSKNAEDNKVSMVKGKSIEPPKRTSSRLKAQNQALSKVGLGKATDRVKSVTKNDPNILANLDGENSTMMFCAKKKKLKTKSIFPYNAFDILSSRPHLEMYWDQIIGDNVHKDLIKKRTEVSTHQNTRRKDDSKRKSKPEASDLLGLKSIGGLDEQIKEVTESINLLLNQQSICEKLNIKADKSFIFYGPPGTGKTSVARALASQYTNTKKPLAYFQFNSPDIVSKNIGESESNLVEIFKAAEQWQPSLMFFDEIDGLIPSRTDKDRAGASLVSTFLQLMDGMNSKGNVIVIGATNRLSAMDPAMRRSGRFGKEVYFPNPDHNGRVDILAKVGGKWGKPLSRNLAFRIAEKTQGFSGADLAALCSKAAVSAFNRTYPDALSNKGANSSKYRDVTVELPDFEKAIQSLKPSRNSSQARLSSFPPSVASILHPKAQRVADYIDQWGQKFPNSTPSYHFPRLVVLKGKSPLAHSHVLYSALEKLDGYQITELELHSSRSSSDRDGIKALHKNIQSIPMDKKAILLIKSASKFLSEGGDTVATTLSNALNTPCKAGKLTYILACDDYTEEMRALRPNDKGFLMDMDKVSEMDILVWLKELVGFSSQNDLPSNLDVELLSCANQMSQKSTESLLKLLFQTLAPLSFSTSTIACTNLIESFKNHLSEEAHPTSRYVVFKAPKRKLASFTSFLASSIQGSDSELLAAEPDIDIES